MELSGLYNRVSAPFIAAIAILCLSSVSFGGADIKPACFRLEGLKMQCTGGGGTPCTETCDPSQQEQTCGGYSICGGQKHCAGTKCDCSCVDTNRCGDFQITCRDGSTKTCNGTTPTVDCSTQPATCPVYATKTDIICTTKSCVGTKSTHTSCTANNPGIDGCQCSCQTSGSDCIPKESGNCHGQCACTKGSSVTCGYKGYTIPTTGSCVYPTGEMETPKQINPCQCACAARPGGTMCSSTCSDTSNQCPYGPDAPCE